MATLTEDFRKPGGPTPSDDVAPLIIDDGGTSTLNFNKVKSCAFQPYLQNSETLISKQEKNSCSSEQRTLDNRVPVQVQMTLSANV